MEDDYPRTMKNWRGVPTPLKAAITWKDGERVFASISLMVQRFYRHVHIHFSLEAIGLIKWLYRMKLKVASLHIKMESTLFLRVISNDDRFF